MAISGEPLMVGWVYMMTNAGKTTLYTGVTNNLERRVWEHRSAKADTFAGKYKLTKLVWCEEFMDIRDAIEAETRIKKGNRARKEKLIAEMNPKWRDLMPATSNARDGHATLAMTITEENR